MLCYCSVWAAASAIGSSGRYSALKGNFPTALTPRGRNLPYPRTESYPGHCHQLPPATLTISSSRQPKTRYRSRTCHGVKPNHTLQLPHPRTKRRREPRFRPPRAIRARRRLHPALPIPPRNRHETPLRRRPARARSTLFPRNHRPAKPSPAYRHLVHRRGAQARRADVQVRRGYLEGVVGVYGATEGFVEFGSKVVPKGYGYGGFGVCPGC